jgi:hypothetical protein
VQLYTTDGEEKDDDAVVVSLSKSIGVDEEVTVAILCVVRVFLSRSFVFSFLLLFS